MTALDWIKARTKTRNDDQLYVDGITYNVATEFFAGHLPRAMIRAASRATLERSDTVHEVIAVHAKSGFTEYTRTTYTPV